VIVTDKRVFEFHLTDGKSWVIERALTDAVAIGSGMKVALVMMKVFDLSPHEAILLAQETDPHTSGHHLFGTCCTDEHPVITTYIGQRATPLETKQVRDLRKHLNIQISLFKKAQETEDANSAVRKTSSPAKPDPKPSKSNPKTKSKK
jgi:hypothetical protein